jgi:hypothetical protein
MIVKTARAAATVPSCLLATIACGLALAAVFTPLAAQKPVVVQLKADDKVGAEPKTFLPIVGDWIITTDEGRRSSSTGEVQTWTAAALVDKARKRRRARGLIDNVASFDYYPTVVAKDIESFENG